MLAWQFWPIFRSLKSHNFLIVGCNGTKLSTAFVNEQSTFLVKYIEIDVTVRNLQLFW